MFWTDSKSLWLTSSAPSTQTRSVLHALLYPSYCFSVIIKGFNSLSERLCYSGTPWITWILDVFTWYWSGCQQFPIITPWTKLVQFFNHLFIFPLLFTHVFIIFSICFAYSFHSCSVPNMFPCSVQPCTSALSHRNVFFIWFSAAGDAGAVTPVVQQHGRSLRSPALRLYGQSTLTACESLVI